MLLAACGAETRAHDRGTAERTERTNTGPIARAIPYPTTHRQDVSETLHGTVVHDPYRWLENGSAPDVMRWVDAQDNVARRFLSELPQRARFIKHLRTLMYDGDVRPPVRRGNGYLYWKRDGSQEKSVFVRRDRISGAELIVLDPNRMFHPDGSSMTIGGASVSPTGRYVAFRVSIKNGDESILRLRDVATGKDLSEDIPGIRHNEVAWDSHDEGFFYRSAPISPDMSTAQKALNAQVKYHKLGTSVATDMVIRDRAGDVNLDETPIASKDGRWLCITGDHGYTRTDVLFRDRLKSGHDWQTLVKGRDAIYEVAVHNGLFYLRTNDGASRYRIVVADPGHPQLEKWQTIVPERADATLKGFRIVGAHLTIHWMKDAASQLEIRDLRGGGARIVSFSELGTFDEISGDVDDTDLFLRFSSFTTAPTIVKVDVGTGAKETFAKVSTAPDETEYVTEQVFFTSKDGTRVPMFIVRRKDLPRDGRRPTILYGYGGFEQSLVPTYRPAALAWLREGGIYAAPNLRGGGEFGRDWHYAGMLERKQNVFDDFFAAAEHMFRLGWTRPQFLAAKGRSNGGLLVAAAITQRPELFRVALPTVPLTDMIRYAMSGSGKTWIPEYGSSDDRSQFATLLAYSPYHHVEQGRLYPSVLMLTADSDDRVDPMHARKFVASLQSASSGGPVLLSVQRNAGHVGADAVKRWVEDEADAYAFAFTEMGVP